VTLTRFNSDFIASSFKEDGCKARVF